MPGGKLSGGGGRGLGLAAALRGLGGLGAGSGAAAVRAPRGAERAPGGGGTGHRSTFRAFPSRHPPHFWKINGSVRTAAR